MSQLAARDPSVRSLEATVESVDDRRVTLDETYFYAESGGQPADRGTVGGTVVEDVQQEGDRVVHRLGDDPDFEAGETVRAEIDDEFRTYCERAHTASHVLYGAGRRVLDDLGYGGVGIGGGKNLGGLTPHTGSHVLYGAGRRVLDDLGYGGFDIGERKIRVDFTTSTEVDAEVLAELERLTNRAVWDSLPVSWAEIPQQEARERDEVAFNTKTEEGVMSDADTVRVVTVADWDWAACGGTHVSNTREIGPVTVLDRSNPGEGLTRVEFAVGPTAIRERAESVRAAREAARSLDVGVADLPEAAERVSREVESLEADLSDARVQLLSARLDDLREDAIGRDGGEWVVGTVSGFGPNEVGDRAKELAGESPDAPDAVVLSGADGATFVVAATGGDPDAGDVVDEVTDAFGGGGGGGPTFAQGGGLDADPEEVAAFLRE